MRTDEILGESIQLLGRNARCDVATHLGQRPAHEKIVLTEQLYLFFSFKYIILSELS